MGYEHLFQIYVSSSNGLIKKYIYAMLNIYLYNTYKYIYKICDKILLFIIYYILLMIKLIMKNRKQPKPKHYLFIS